jgi:hypothetical protein
MAKIANDSLESFMTETQTKDNKNNPKNRKMICPLFRYFYPDRRYLVGINDLLTFEYQLYYDVFGIIKTEMYLRGVGMQHI